MEKKHDNFHGREDSLNILLSELEKHLEPCQMWREV